MPGRPTAAPHSVESCATFPGERPSSSTARPSRPNGDQDRRRGPHLAVRRGATAAERRVVHARQVIQHERRGVSQFDGHGGIECVVRRGAAGIGGRQHEERAPAMRLPAVGIHCIEHGVLHAGRGLGEAPHRISESLLHRREMRGREGLEGGILYQSAWQRGGAHQTGTRPVR